MFFHWLFRILSNIEFVILGQVYVYIVKQKKTCKHISNDKILKWAKSFLTSLNIKTSEEKLTSILQSKDFNMYYLLKFVDSLNRRNTGRVNSNIKTAQNTS